MAEIGGASPGVCHLESRKRVQLSPSKFVNMRFSRNFFSVHVSMQIFQTNAAKSVMEIGLAAPATAEWEDNGPTSETLSVII